MVFAQALVYFPEGLHKGVVLAVAYGTLEIGVFVYHQPDAGGGFHFTHQVETVVEQADVFAGSSVYEYIADDVGQVLGRYVFFFVAELDNALSHFFHVLWTQFDAQFLEVFEDVGLAGGLAQSIAPHAAETFGHELVEVEVVFIRSEERRVGKECRSWWSTYH